MRKALIGCLLVGSLIGPDQGMAATQRSGTEYLPAGSLPGDQSQPLAVLQNGGGLLVWEDPYADLQGNGLFARHLDGNLSGVYSPFQLNTTVEGDQQNAQGAVLANGGFVFVWESQQGAESQVRGRLMGPNRVFQGPDFLISAQSGLHTRPDVAALPDGGFVVVWQTFQPGNAMNEVRARIFDPSGQASIQEFAVNSHTALNQRDAVVESGADGFVVAWVSELQFESDSIGLVTRKFSHTGEATGAEMRQDTVAHGAAAQPSLTDLETGFGLVWAQKDLSQLSNGFDILYRALNEQGVATGVASVVNTHRYGDQFDPSISSGRGQVLVTWTALGQDGSLEGVYARWISGEENEFQVHTTVEGPQHQSTVSNDGLGGYLVAWSGYQPLDGFNLFSQVFQGSDYVPAPPAPFVITESAGSVRVAWPVLNGFEQVSYQVIQEGIPEIHSFQENNVVITGLAPGQSLAFRLRYVLADGTQSIWSAAGSGSTWGLDGNSDLLPDDWQRTYFGTVSTQWGGAHEDSDGDGATNLAELLAGTDPSDSESVLKGGVQLQEGQLSYSWRGAPGHIYQLQVSKDLKDWDDVGEPFMAVGDLSQVALNMAGQVGYYRVILIR